MDVAPSVPSALKVLHSLAILARAPEPMGLSEMATAMGMPRPTVHRLLAALVRDGWAFTTGSPRRYAASWRIVELGFSAAATNRARSVLLEVLRDTIPRLSPYTLLTTFYERGEVIVTDAVEARSGRVISRLVGSRLPAAISSAGRMYLAHQDEAEVERVLAIPIEKRTAWTKTSREEILHEIQVAWQHGYAVIEREIDPASSGITVPVFNGGVIVAMIGLSSIPGTVSEDVLARVIGPMLEAASAAASELGSTRYS